MHTVTARYVENAITAIEKLGVEKDVLYEKLSAQGYEISHPEERLNSESLRLVFDFGRDITALQNIGLDVGQQFSVSFLYKTGRALSFCKDVREVIETNKKYHKLTQNFATTNLKVDGDSAFYRWEEDHDFEVYRDVTIAIIVSFFIGFRKLTQRPHETVNAVYFKCKAPQDRDAFDKFFGCPVYFGVDKTAIAFKSRDLDLPIATSNPTMRAELCRQLDERLRIVEKHGEFVECLRAVISQLIISQSPSLSSSAQKLNISKRCLRSRLQTYGTTFRQVVNDVRRETCIEYMANSLRFSDIAQLLGFHDQAAFNRSFKAWFGVSPRNYMKQAGVL